MTLRVRLFLSLLAADARGRWYVRLSRFGAGEQMPLFPAEVRR